MLSVLVFAAEGLRVRRHGRVVSNGRSEHLGDEFRAHPLADEEARRVHAWPPNHLLVLNLLWWYLLNETSLLKLLSIRLIVVSKEKSTEALGRRDP